jgi:hypothetical protein
VGTETQGIAWCKEVQKILESKNQMLPPKASAKATEWNASTQRYWFSLKKDGMLYLDLQTQDPEPYQDKPCQLRIPTRLRNRILQAVHDGAVGGYFTTVKLYMTVKQCVFLPGVQKEVHDCTKAETLTNKLINRLQMS